MNTFVDNMSEPFVENVTESPRDVKLNISVCPHYNSPGILLLVLLTLRLYVHPIISILGFGANMMSIVILRKSGLSKPSNIILLGLVVADSMTLLLTMNFAKLLQFFGPNYQYPDMCGWQYGDGVNYFLMASDIIFLFFGNWGQYVSTTIPMVITVERFLAVYMPMTYKIIITVKTAWTSVIVSFVIWMPWTVFYMSLYFPVEMFPNVLTLQLLFSTPELLKLYDFLNYFVLSLLSNFVPMVIVGVGCLLIGVKVKVTLMQRKKLTSGKEKVPWSARTTRTLLLTCVFLFINITACSMFGLFEARLKGGYYYSFLLEMTRLTQLLNASSNFFVYIATNRKFFIIFINVFKHRAQQHNQSK